jgi:hypothetical protein
MENDRELPLFPIAGWEAAPIIGQPAVILRLDYLATPADLPENANHGLRHVMTVRQARELAATLERVALRAESGAVRGGPGPAPRT